MNQRFASLFALVCLAASTTTWAASIPKYKMRSPLVKVDGREVSALSAPQRSFGTNRSQGASAISPGTQIGSTYYDYQQNGSMGRMVDHAGNQVQADWMKGASASLSIRTVNWNRVLVTGSPANFTLDNGSTVRRLPLSGPLLAEGQAFNAVRPGYANFRNRPNGKGVAQYHDFPESGGIQYWEAQLDLTAGAGIFAGSPSVSPNPPGPGYQATAVVWPREAISPCGADTIHHAIGTWSGDANEVWYWRGIINDGAGSITWNVSQPVKIDNADAFITNVIEARGSEVQIFMLKSVNNTNNDLVRYVSTDCGLTWGPMQNITNYSPTGPEGGNVDVAIVYDAAGQIHAIFDTAPASGESSPTNLYHWSAATGLRLITSAGWTNSCVNGTLPTSGANNGAGTNNLAIAEPNLSVKAAGVHGIPDELFYAVWTQYGPTDNDCATVDAVGTLGGHVNGEIYCSVSSNGGLTWDRPQNITGTVTPDCLPGNCYSESWVSSAAVADSGLYLSYVDDRHAGSIVFGGGAWADSPYKVYAPEARVPVLEPVIAVTPLNYIELNADPTGGVSHSNLNIISVGNANLTYTVSVTNAGGGASHLTVNGGPSSSNTILAGGAPHVIDVGYDAVGLTNPSEHHWQLSVVSNDPQNDPGQGGNPILVDLQVFAANPWYTCTTDTLSTSSHRMQVSSCLEMGDQGTDGTGFFNYADSAEWVYTGSPVITLVKGGNDTVAYHNAFMGLADRTRILNKSFRAQGLMTVQRNTSITVGDSTFFADRATGLASTTDTTIQINYEMIFPRKANLSHGAVFKFSIKSNTGSPISGVSYGVAADLDVDPSAGENGGAGSDPKGWIGAVGGESDTASNFTPNNNFIALFHVPTGSACVRDGAVAAQVLSNANYVVPDASYNVDSLYKLFKTFGQLGSWGTNIHIDTGQQFDDVSAMMVSGYNQTLSNATFTNFAYGVAVSDVSKPDLEATIEALRSSTVVPCQISCLIVKAGDVNVSGAITSADIISMVGYVFKGGAEPLPCKANGDVNCSGTVTSADIIYLVNHVFKGQPAPCDICNSGTPLVALCN